MTQSTSPDNLALWTLQDGASLTGPSQALGNSVQNALNKRQRYDFVWPTSAERTAQTGMVQGSRGYQVDTKSEYSYDNSAWRLALSHAEFTASVSTGNNTLTNAGVFTIDSSKSTDTTFVTPSTSGILLVASPGIYAISTVTATTSAIPMTSRAFLDLAYSSGLADIQRVSIVVGEDRGSLASPNVRVTTANQTIYFQHFINIASPPNTVSTRARITRIG